MWLLGHNTREARDFFSQLFMLILLLHSSRCEKIKFYQSLLLQFVSETSRRMNAKFLSKKPFNYIKYLSGYSKFRGFSTIATARVDGFSKFKMPRVGKRKGYPKKIFKKYFFCPLQFFFHFRNKLSKCTEWLTQERKRRTDGRNRGHDLLTPASRTQNSLHSLRE